jgi:hypothetical protein
MAALFISAVDIPMTLAMKLLEPNPFAYDETDEGAPPIAKHQEVSPLVSIAELPLSTDAWLNRDMPAPDRLVGNWMTTTSRVLFTADTGVGKTNWLLAVFSHMAAGIDFLHWRIEQPRRVLYVDGEMSRRLLKQRVEDATRRLGVDPPGLHILSHEDVEDFQPLNTEAGRKFILEVVEHVGAEAVAFDNIMALILGDMREEDAWRDTLPLVNQLTRSGVGQIWVHHTGHDASRSYGTKTKEWRMDTTLHGIKFERGDTDVSFLLEFRKARERTPTNRGDFVDIKVALVNDEWIGDIGSVAHTRKPSPLGAKFLLALRNVLASSTTTKFQSWKAVTLQQWRDECLLLGLIEKDKEASARSLLSKHKRELIGCNIIACNNDLVWII